jgi:hypothetical protein
MKKIIVVLSSISIFLFSCSKNQLKNEIAFWGSFYSKGDSLRISINDKLTKKLVVKRDYFFSPEKPFYLIRKYKYELDSSKIAIHINSRDTILYVKNDRLKTIIVGRNIYGDIMIDYVYSSGKRTFSIE